MVQVVESVKQKDVEQPQDRYSEEKLSEFREIITQKLGAAREDFTGLVELYQPHPGEDVSFDRIRTDQIDDLMSGYTLDDEQVKDIFLKQIKYLKALEGALYRVDHGIYGICRVTGKLIPEGRLRAVPHTTLSVEGKDQMN